MRELDQLASAVDQVLNLDSAAHGSQTAMEVLKLLATQANRLQAAIVITTSAARADGSSAGDVGEFLTHECHYSGREAARLVAVAEQLTTALPTTLAALASGRITWAHAATVARAEKSLGQAHVSDHEQAWISNVANQAGPERLQRMVRALADEQGIGRDGATQATERLHEPEQPSTTCLAAAATKSSIPDHEPANEPEHSSGAEDATPSQAVHLRSVADEEVVEPAQARPATSMPVSPAGTASPDVTETQTTTDRCVHPGCANDARHRQLACTIRLLPAVDATMTVGMVLCDAHLADVEPRVIATELDVAVNKPTDIAA
jgi:hypothetical protein